MFEFPDHVLEEAFYDGSLNDFLVEYCMLNLDDIRKRINRSFVLDELSDSEFLKLLRQERRLTDTIFYLKGVR